MIIFVSCAAEDIKHAELLIRDLKASSKKPLGIWYRGCIEGGHDTKKTTKEALRTANIFIALLSLNFLASNECRNDELSYALRRKEEGKICVIPVLLNHCDWKQPGVSSGSILPSNKKPVLSARPQDRAWTEVITAINKIIDQQKEAQHAFYSNTPFGTLGQNTFSDAMTL